VRLVRRTQRGGGRLGQSVLEAGPFRDAGLARQPLGRFEFASVLHRIYFAVKANRNLAVLRVLREGGERRSRTSFGERSRR
jgi:hypothetical protein